MKKKIGAAICSILAALATVTTIHADEILSKEEIINDIWEERWFGTGDDGTEFPEASYNHHLLEEWVETNYANNNDYDWGDIGRLKYQYSDYYSDKTGEWTFTDEEGRWYITDEEGVVYHFLMFQGEWNMIDSNGNVVDIFKPFNTLGDNSELVVASEDDFSSESHRVVVDNKEAAHQRASEWAANKNTNDDLIVTACTSEEEDREEEKTDIYVGEAIAAICLIVSFVYVLSRRGDINI